MRDSKDSWGREERRGCVAVARHRAARARRKGAHPALVALLFVWWLMSGWNSPPRSSIFPAPPSPLEPVEGNDHAEWPVTEYERGPAEPVRQRGRAGAGRYRTRPPLVRLIRDLRRPVARQDATMALASRLADADLRAWVVERIVLGDIARLALHVRSGRDEGSVFEAWQRERDAELFQDARGGDVALASDRETLLAVARLLEALAQGGEATSTRLTPKK